MDKHIAELEQTTGQIVLRINQVSFEEMSDFVEQRQTLMDHLIELTHTQPLSPNQIKKLKDILEHDPAILERMQVLKDEAGSWLKQRGKAKVQRSVYEANYASDSILMDRRK